MAQRNGEAADEPTRSDPEAAAPDARPTGSEPGPGVPSGDETVWSRFEALMAAQGDADADAEAPARAFAPRPAAVAPAAVAPFAVVTPAPGAPRPSAPNASPAVSGPASRESALRDPVGRPAFAPPASVGAGARLPRRAVWVHRAEGAVAMGAVALVAFAAGWLRATLAPEPERPTAPIARQEAEAEAAFAADSLLALAESARVAAIAAADPPYRVVLHVEDGVAARDLARLDTAIRAWGFQQPERVAATESIPLPEVRFFDEGDREAAITLGGVAERLLGEAALTPPSRAAEPAAPLAGLAAPEAAADEAESSPAPRPARLLELHVPARLGAAPVN